MNPVDRLPRSLASSVNRCARDRSSAVAQSSLSPHTALASLHLSLASLPTTSPPAISAPPPAITTIASVRPDPLVDACSGGGGVLGDGIGAATGAIGDATGGVFGGPAGAGSFGSAGGSTVAGDSTIDAITVLPSS